jgi:hypothetical protein
METQSFEDERSPDIEKYIGVSSKFKKYFRCRVEIPIVCRQIRQLFKLTLVWAFNIEENVVYSNICVCNVAIVSPTSSYQDIKPAFSGCLNISDDGLEQRPNCYFGYCSSSTNTS